MTPLQAVISVTAAFALSIPLASFAGDGDYGTGGSAANRSTGMDPAW